MACLWSDSFDYYGSVADVTQRYTGSGTNGGAANLTTSTAFGVGQGLTDNHGTATNFVFAAAFLTASNEATVYQSVRFNTGLSSTSSFSFFFRLKDAATNQVTMELVFDGTIRFRTGGNTGTIIGTTGAGAFTPGSWNSFQVKYVINSATGSIELRLNGSTTPILTITNVNTRGGSTNNFVNGFDFFNTNTFGPIIDDLFFNSDNGAAPTTWPGDVRLLWSPVNSNVSNQFSPSPSSYFLTANTAGTNTNTEAGNQVAWVQFIPSNTGILASLNASIGATATGHFKMALYDNLGAGGSPGALLATSAELTSLALGTNVFSVASGPQVTAGVTYFLAFQADVTTTHQSSGTINFYRVAQTYGAFPNPQSGAVAFTGLAGLHFNFGVGLTSLNWAQVGNATEDGDASTIFSNTVGNQDVYGIAGLGTINPASIVGVNFITFWKKSDSGARTGTIGVAANGSADTPEISGITPGLSYGFSTKFVPQDPTPANWTTASVNGMHVSVTVAS